MQQAVDVVEDVPLADGVVAGAIRRWFSEKFIFALADRQKTLLILLFCGR
jgi:hypothetical protein